MDKNDKRFSLIVIGIVILDQLTKLLVHNLGEKIAVIENFFYINFVKNTGAGFSLFANLDNSNTFLIYTTFIILGIIFINYPKIEDNLKPFIAMIVAGAIGNLIDRIAFGYVIDFLDFVIWPVFNIADSSITIAGMILIYKIIRKG